MPTDCQRQPPAGSGSEREATSLQNGRLVIDYNAFDDHTIVESEVAGRPTHRRLRRLQGLPAGGLLANPGASRVDGPTDLLRVVIAKPYPPEVVTTYSARCAGDVGITVLDAFECWHYQHGLRHTGEIELARGFLGLSGMTA